MSTFAYLYVNDSEVYHWRNELDHAILRIFSKSDIVDLRGQEAIDYVKAHNLNAYEDYEDDGEQFSVTMFNTYVGEIKDRLKTQGYSVVSLHQFIDDMIDLEEREVPSEVGHEIFGKRIQAIKSMRTSFNSGKTLSAKESEILDSILEYDSCFALFYAINNEPPDASVILDISDFAYEGWYDNSYHDLMETGDTYNRLSTPPIILTEGVFDREVLKESIELLAPHLKGYIKFLDTDYKLEGGAASVVKTLKSFAAAGISNRVLAILDNDSAAHEARTGLKGVKLPAAYRVVHYPELEFCKNYPTIGPQGNANMDINGLAVSVELFLGEDTLKDESGKYLPVQWTGYMSGVKSYQGEVSSKGQIQKLFLKKLKEAKSDPSLIESQDWSSMRVLVDGIIEELSTL